MPNQTRRDLRNAEREWRNTDHRRFHVERRTTGRIASASRPLFRRLWRWFWS